MFVSFILVDLGSTWQYDLDSTAVTLTLNNANILLGVRVTASRIYDLPSKHFKEARRTSSTFRSSSFALVSVIFSVLCSLIPT